jgi:flagellar hook-basal body complex protein FliE
MDIQALKSLSNNSININGTNNVESKNRNETFEKLFQSALSMVNETNNLTNTAEKAEISYALGLTDSTHDLQVAQQKANISLQYTVAVRNKVLEAYKEIMNLQF